jgi:prefoldin alpha subunit
MTDKEDFQKKFYEFNLYRKQAEGMIQELTMLAETAEGLKQTQETLGNVKKLEKDAEILVPLGGNSFGKAKLTDPKNVLIGVGSDVVMEKSAAQADKILEDRTKEVEKAKAQLEEQVKELDKHMSKLEPEIEKLAGELKKEEKPKKA